MRLLFYMPNCLLGRWGILQQVYASLLLRRQQCLCVCRASSDYQFTSHARPWFQAFNDAPPECAGQVEAYYLRLLHYCVKHDPGSGGRIHQLPDFFPVFPVVKNKASIFDTESKRERPHLVPERVPFNGQNQQPIFVSDTSEAQSISLG